jgi:hypothetical protein
MIADGDDRARVNQCRKLFEEMSMKELILSHTYLGEQMAYREAARSRKVPIAKIMG